MITQNRFNYIKNRFNNNIILYSSKSGEAYMCRWTGSSLDQSMTCCLFSAKPSFGPVLTYCKLNSKEPTKIVCYCCENMNVSVTENLTLWILLIFIFSYDQAALRTLQSVCLSVRPSVRLSVCHTFFTMFLSSYHHEIVKNCYQWQKWCPCKRSRSEVKRSRSQVKTHLTSFQTVTPVWLHTWHLNDS